MEMASTPAYWTNKKCWSSFRRFLSCLSPRLLATLGFVITVSPLKNRQTTQASLTPPPPRNFQFPLWWGNGYFLEPYISENFAPHFSLKFLSIFVYILGSIKLITDLGIIGKTFSPSELEYRWGQFWSKVMTSEVEERLMLVTAGYSWRRSPCVYFTTAY